jgi:dihydroorotate dehydrogenase (NAD+) catalytic subunit
MANLAVKLGPLTLQNPIIAASGTFGYGLEYEKLLDLNALGGIVVKGLSPEERKGNPPPRIVETACGMLNSIGLQNIGVEAFLRDKLPALRKYEKLAVFANVYGHSADEYLFVAQRLANAEGVAGIELNLSCPNVTEGGLAFGTDPETVRSLTAAVREIYPGFLIVKLSPNVTDIGLIAKAAEDGGADCLSLINTLLGIAVDIEKRAPVLGGVTGGLSGPAIKPVALRMVHQVAQAVKIPIMGMGGISNSNDALEFLMVGATALQVGTANFQSPTACIEILREMDQWLDAHSFKDINDWIGTLEI